MTLPVRWLCGAALSVPLMVGFAGSPMALTVADLQGAYDLKMDALPSAFAGGTGFDMISETLEIEGDTLTFAPTFAGTGPFTLAGNTVTVADTNGFADVVEASFADTGNRLTLIDEIGDDLETFVFTRRDGSGSSNQVTEATLQGTYDLDVANTAVKNFPHLVAGKFEVAGKLVTASLTFARTGSFTLAGSTITLIDTNGDTSVIRAAFSDDGSALRLTFVEEGQTFVYEKR